MEAAAREMPRYKSHKTVWALKIAEVIDQRPTPPEGAQHGEGPGPRTLVPEDKGYAPFEVDSSYVAKHNPQPGGYYVVYADGYKSFSPAKAFEEGNTLIGDQQEAEAPPLFRFGMRQVVHTPAGLGTVIGRTEHAAGEPSYLVRDFESESLTEGTTYSDSVLRAY